MTQEQLGIASGLLVVLLTAFWPVLSSLESQKTNRRNAGDPENPGNFIDFRTTRTPPIQPGDQVISGDRNSSEAANSTSPLPSISTPANDSSADPLISSLPDLSRRS